MANPVDWQPSASLENLRVRAKLLTQTRNFFAQRDVLEVETPLLGEAPASDPHLNALVVESDGLRYLQTSPEYAMKRLLAAGSGAIYQVCKAFRAAEQGSRHNTEFTMLEWYRPDFSLTDLQDEVAALLNVLLSSLQGERSAVRYSYRDLFAEHLNLDPHNASLNTLRDCAMKHVDIELESDDRDLWLDLLMSHVIEPQLGREEFSFVYGFPASQAALAQVDLDAKGTLVAQRFELYINGMEVANAYLELRNADEQAARFAVDLEQRAQQGLPIPPLDRHLASAMQAGLPACAGVALGFDRLMMVALGTNKLSDVAFI